jgi:hypothetical protein
MLPVGLVWIVLLLGSISDLGSGFGISMLGSELAGPVMVGTGMFISGTAMLGSAMSPSSRARACIDKHESNIDDRIMHPSLILLTTTIELIVRFNFKGCPSGEIQTWSLS